MIASLSKTNALISVSLLTKMKNNKYHYV